MDIRLFLIAVIFVACNTSTQYQALCEEAESMTRVEIDQNLVGRRLIWHTTVSDVVRSSEGDLLVFINDDHIEVKHVPEEIGLKLGRGQPFNFIGTIEKLNENCFGEVTFNELNKSNP